MCIRNITSIFKTVNHINSVWVQSMEWRGLGSGLEGDWEEGDGEKGCGKQLVRNTIIMALSATVDLETLTLTLMLNVKRLIFNSLTLSFTEI